MSEETLGLLRGLSTVLAMLAFVAVAAWAWSRRQQGRFDAAAQLPLEEDQRIGQADSWRTSDRDPSRRKS